MIQLTTDSYFCYILTPQPFINNVDTINVQLIAPLPPSGTIMTGLSENGDRFALYLEYSQLLYELTNDNETVLSISSQNLNLNSSYQVSLVRQSDQVEVTVSLISVDLQSEERFNGILTGDESMESVVFESICVGGGLLEVPNYEGIESNVFFNYFALSEERNFDELDQMCVLRMDHVYIQPSMASPSLQFEKQTLENNRISFELRTPENAVASVLLFSTNDEFELLITNFNGDIASISSVVGDSASSLFNVCPLTSSLNNGEWHHIDMQRTETGLMFMIDRRPCDFSHEDLPERLNSLANAPLQFGATTDDVEGDASPGVAVPFEGCFQNIEFRREVDSEPFRPNLEVAINTEESFNAIGCFNCSSSHEVDAGCSDECNCIFTESNQPSCSCPGDGDSCPSELEMH